MPSEVVVDAGASAVQAHQVAVNAEHNLLHALPRSCTPVRRPERVMIIMLSWLLTGEKGRN